MPEATEKHMSRVWLVRNRSSGTLFRPPVGILCTRVFLDHPLSELPSKREPYMSSRSTLCTKTTSQ